MAIENWDEIRTAYHVARLGTVSGAAEVMGVHHATVIRHIDALENRLGTKLFQRHARGYTPTEAGRELLKVAQGTDEQFAHLSSKIAGAASDMAGELIVTGLPGMSPMIAPALSLLQRAHPDLTVRYLTDLRIFRLEFGEAHVAVRAGQRPQEPDNVVQPLMSMTVALYASRDYEQRYGLPKTEADLVRHRFLGPENDDSKAPFYRWLLPRVPRGAIVFRSNDLASIHTALEMGVGMGFLTAIEARQKPDLIQVLPPHDDWSSELWLVTHVDLHRTPKIQAALAALKHEAQACASGKRDPS